MRVLLTVALLSTIGLAGCLNTDSSEDPIHAPSFDYQVPEIDLNLPLLMEDIVYSVNGVDLHIRVTRPDTSDPVPVMVQDTPYTAPGCATAGYGAAIEPPVIGCSEGTFETQFARRGYAYVHGDLRGTGSSTGCINLRGQADIDDIGALADSLAAEPWSNGNVGFIGASYPGSTSHMAALSGSTAVKAVVPVVASTSFYHYHHNSGVPYNGNHALGGTNTGYTSEGVTPTLNPIESIQKLLDQPTCPHAENAIMHGGLDQSGSYYAWWQERNLRPLAETVTVPVLMAQGLTDWNVKPDHVASWFNDIKSENKVFIGGQWGHAYPASDEGACAPDVDTDDDAAIAACTTPWGNWWAYAAAFFDTYLKEIDTGMFDGSVAWVQDNDRTWHRSESWPIVPSWPIDFNEDLLLFALQPDGSMTSVSDHSEEGRLTWYACPHDTYNRGAAGVSTVESLTIQCDDEPVQSLVFETEPFAQDTILSGVPHLMLTVESSEATTHLTVVVDQLDDNGNVVVPRENYGYLNTAYLGPDGLFPLPEGGDNIHIMDLYPQEDFVPAGHSLRVTIGSNDGGRTIEAYPEGTNTLVFADDTINALLLPTRPADLWGTRLPADA